MFFHTLNDDQIKYAERETERLEKVFKNANNKNKQVLPSRKRIYTGVCGEITFVSWLRFWGIDDWSKMPDGHSYDFEVCGKNIEVACTDGWYEKKQYLKRQPSTVETNAPAIDYVVGIAAINERETVFYGWTEIDVVVNAPLMDWRDDAPPMHSVEIAVLHSTAFLRMLLLDAFPEARRYPRGRLGPPAQ